MESKKTVLVRVSYLVDFNENEINEDDGLLDKLENKVCKDRSFKIENRNLKLKWEYTSSIVLDSKDYNCGKCVICGAWVTDVEREDSIEGLCPGARVEGALYCDEHLPKEHPRAF